MKKIFKAGAIALVVFASVGSAVAEKVAKQPKANEEVYSWTQNGGTNPYVGTKSQAEDFYGCRGTADVCASGAANNPTIPDEVIYLH